MNPSPTDSALVDLQDVSIEYRRGRKTFRAVNEVTFDIREGETVGLVGESGSGKTTIGRAIQGLIRVSEGRIALEGTSIDELKGNRSRRIARDIQTVFQDPFGSLNPARTIGSTLAEPVQVHEPHLTRAAIRKRVLAELEQVGLPAAAANRFPIEFSGGQRQRIAIARAIITRPRLVICDEAVSALDLSIQAQILNLLAEIQLERGVSYLFITHDLAVVRHIADRVIVLRSGRVVDRFGADEFDASDRATYTQRLLEAAPVPDPARQRARRAAFEDLATSNAQEIR